MTTKVQWKKNGPVAAQLFRDIYFKKFTHSTTVPEIHACPNRPYSQLNLNTFYKHVKATQTRVENYRNLGTGLDNEDFVNLVRLNEPPPKEDSGPTEEDLLDSDSEGSDYTLGEEDTDEEAFEDCTLESALKDLNLNGGNIKDVRIPTSKLKNKANPTPRKLPAPLRMSSFRDPINMVYPDKKRILILFEADGEVQNIEDVQRITIREDGDGVVRYTKTPKAKTDAIKLIGGVVDGANKEKNEDIANLKAYLDQRKKEVKAEISENGDIWEVRDEIKTEFKVETQMYDNNGQPIDDFLIDTDGDGLYWCFFWLRGVHAKDSTPGKKKGRRVGLAAA